MINLGRLNNLTVVRHVPFGLYLDGGEDGDILLPKRYVPEGCQIGEELQVFVYTDSEDELVATTQRPKAMVGQFAYLKVVSVNQVGAFLDWGLAKDLLVPYPEQRRPMQEGKSYLVYVNIDNEGRVVATSRIDRFLDRWPVKYKKGEAVQLIIAEKTELGIKAIINHAHWGLIHHEDVFGQLRYGSSVQGFVKNVREDGKVDLVTSKPGRDKVDELAEAILTRLQESGGFLPLHDKTPAEDIQQRFGESKKSFKSAIGLLYKQRKIIIEVGGIRLSK